MPPKDIATILREAADIIETHGLCPNYVHTAFDKVTFDALDPDARQWSAWAAFVKVSSTDSARKVAAAVVRYIEGDKVKQGAAGNAFHDWAIGKSAKETIKTLRNCADSLEK